MSDNSAFKLFGRRLRLAVIGGGPGSFIGAMHRQAARVDDRYELVAAALSSDPERSRTTGQAIGVTPDRCYPRSLGGRSFPLKATLMFGCTKSSGLW